MIELNLDMMTIRSEGCEINEETTALIRTAALTYLSRGWKKASARFTHKEFPHAFYGTLYHKGEGTFLGHSGTLFVAEVLINGNEGHVHFLVIAGAERRTHPDLFGQAFLSLASASEPVDTQPSRPIFIKIPMKGFEIEKNIVN